MVLHRFAEQCEARRKVTPEQRLGAEIRVVKRSRVIVADSAHPVIAMEIRRVEVDDELFPEPRLDDRVHVVRDHDEISVMAPARRHVDELEVHAQADRARELDE